MSTIISKVKFAYSWCSENVNNTFAFFFMWLNIVILLKQIKIIIQFRLMHHDGATNKEKDVAWFEIENANNCQQVTDIKTIRQLKSVYDVQN